MGAGRTRTPHCPLPCPLYARAADTDVMGMTLVRESHYGDFSLYFLASMPEGFAMARAVPPPSVSPTRRSLRAQSDANIPY